MSWQRKKPLVDRITVKSVKKNSICESVTSPMTYTEQRWRSQGCARNPKHTNTWIKYTGCSIKAWACILLLENSHKFLLMMVTAERSVQKHSTMFREMHSFNCGTNLDWHYKWWMHLSLDCCLDPFIAIKGYATKYCYSPNQQVTKKCYSLKFTFNNFAHQKLGGLLLPCSNLFDIFRCKYQVI